ncbi:hypothetical protein ACHAW6_000181 [Cyclotella cf. meneghiniana]
MSGKHMLTIYSKHSRSTMKYPDWNGTHYIGLTLQWDYHNCLVHLAMPGYCEKAGQHFHHSQPTKPQHQPYPSAPRTYGNKQQFCDSADSSPALSKDKKTFVQEVIGVFLYYARAVDCTMLTALGSLAVQQANPMENTLAKIHQFLDYALTHPDAVITYQASDMVLAAHSGASYLQKLKHAVVPVGISFSPKTTTTLPTMGLSSPLPKSSKLLCPQQPSQNLVHLHKHT